MPEFEPWPKIPRYNRPVVITEKIDGTNAAILILPQPFGAGVEPDPNRLAIHFSDEVDEGGDPLQEFHVYAQSRTRFITPGAGRDAGRDNAGFAGYVHENSLDLVRLLGPGRHFGEWYGKGIGRGYGLEEKRFALFNVHRWEAAASGRLGRYVVSEALRVDVVPVLGILEGPMSEPEGVAQVGIDALLEHGSALVPGFDRPEGVILYHTAAKQLFKVLIEGDDLPKSVTDPGAPGSFL